MSASLNPITASCQTANGQDEPKIGLTAERPLSVTAAEFAISGQRTL
jgi:hypothetical protein